jgi:hypothetical protein
MKKNKGKTLKYLSVSKIYEIHPTLHRVKLTGPYRHENFIENSYKIKIDNSENKKRKSGYKTKAWLWIDNFKTDVFFDPPDDFFPQCKIEFNLQDERGRKCLEKISKDFPYMKISSIEYAIDFIFKRGGKNEDARNLFFLLLKCLYFKKIKRHKLLYRENENYTYYVGKRIKIYERGKDSLKKKEGGWKYDLIDRVRLEITADRYMLNKLGLKNPHQLLNDCKFFEVFKNYVNFAKFKNCSQKLEQEFDPYNTKISGYIVESFQELYNSHLKRKTMANLFQSVETDDDFEPFKREIFLSIIEFQTKWRGKAD